MKKHVYKISALVTGVGAIIGQGIIKSLRACSRYSVHIIGIDKSAKSPGPSFCDVFHQKPLCSESDPQYLEFWQQILEKEKIDIILPGLEIDVDFFNNNRSFFHQHKTPVAINHSDLIIISADKWLLNEKLRELGSLYIPSLIPTTWENAISKLGTPPFIFKPRQGNGSRGIVRLNDKADFLYWLEKSQSDCLIQRIVGQDSDEYTVGMFGLGNGKAIPPIIFRRRLSSAGNTQEAQVENDDLIANASNFLTKELQPLGPTNYQFRKEGNSIFLLEINPRFSSSNSLRTAFNYNESEMAIDLFVFNRQPPAPRIRHGIAWRYSEDYIIYDSSSI